MGEFACAPVLLIGFNRPERLAAQIARLRAVRPSRLFVAVDGPRADRPDEAEAVARTREAVRLVDWPCAVATRFLEENHGCRFAPPEAISWMLETVAGEGGGGVLSSKTTVCRQSISCASRPKCWRVTGMTKGLA